MAVRLNGLYAGTFAVGVAAFVSACAGVVVARDPRIVVVPAAILLLLAPAKRFGQVVLAVALTEGITHPLGHVGHYDPAFLLVWFAICLLAVRRNGLGVWPRTQRLSLIAYAVALLLSGATVGASLGWSPTLRLLNYVGIAVLAAQLLSVGRGVVVAPVIFALLFHIAIGLTELTRNATFFYSRWKPLEATRVDGVTRIASTVGDPNYLALTLLLLAGIAITLRHDFKWPRVATGASVAAILLIPATFSRGGMIALGVAAGVSAVRHTSPRNVVAIGLMVLALAGATAVFSDIAPGEYHAFRDRFAFSQPADASVSSRTAIQGRGLALAESHLVLGLGAGMFERTQRAYLDPSQPLSQQTDVLDTYLEAALSGGIAAVLGFCGLVLGTAAVLVRRASPLGFALAGAAAGVAALDTLSLAPLWVAVSVGAGLIGTHARAIRRPT